MSDDTAAPRDEVAVILDAIERASDYLHNSRAWASEGVIEEIIVPAVRQAIAAAERRGMERAALVAEAAKEAAWERARRLPFGPARDLFINAMREAESIAAAIRRAKEGA